MKDTKNIVKATNNYGLKDPSLKDLYFHVFNKEMENAHNSKYDVINLYLSIKKLYDQKQLNYKFKFSNISQINKYYFLKYFLFILILIFIMFMYLN
jgi:hypothetical protein